MIYVEVELGTGKDTEYRVQKWINLCTASSGQIYVVCDTKRAVKALTSEINSALVGFAYSSHLTDLEELQAKKRGKDGSMWIYQRLRVRVKAGCKYLLAFTGYSLSKYPVES